MEVHQLKYFVAVAEVGTFGGAARRCNVAQPSLSQQILKLEDELGHKLFDRLGRSIALTEAGSALLPRARRILAEIREVEHLGEAVDAGATRVAVGIIPTMAPYLLPRAIQRFARLWPTARLALREDLTDNLVEALVLGDLDVAVMSTPVKHEAIRIEVIATERLLVAVPADGPLANKDSLGLRDLHDHATVMLDEMHCLGQQVEEFCRAMRVQHRVMCRATQLATVQRLVEQGLGIALVPEMAANADRSKRRAYVPIRGQGPVREIALARRVGRSRAIMSERFVDLIRP
jgi:LysR family hydrogen peroxide-inducible transcriptional activator